MSSRSFCQPLLDLVRPLNLLVLSIVFIIHLFVLMMVCGLEMGFLTIIPVLLLTLIVILAHYGNVIDEIGVVGQDELPRFMRDLNMHEDLWWPSMRVATALVLVYGLPAAMFILPMPVALSLAAVPFLIGTFFFPAIILTLQTSGSIANLRPDRVLGVIRQTASRYIAVVLMFAFAIIPYVVAMDSLCATVLEKTLFGAGIAFPGVRPSIALPMLCIGIFLMHAFCWELGLLYRVDGDRFPWVGRYHVRENRPPVVRRKPKYVTPNDSSSRLP